MFDYSSYALEKINSYNSFSESVKIFERKTNKTFKLKGFVEFMLERYYYVRDKFNLFHSLQIHDNLVPIFITSTAPSKYHVQKDIDGAYSALIKFRHDLYNNFKVNNKHIKCKNINVIEPHKSMIPHQHSVYYVLKEHENAFLKHYYRTLKNHGFSKKGQDFKVLDSSPFAIIYLLKYIEKSMRGEDMVLIGWYKKHGIRQFQTSKIPNFNHKIWRLMINNKDYFFPDKKYNLVEAYRKIELKTIDDDSYKTIDDSSFTIYKVKIVSHQRKSVSSNKEFLLQIDHELPLIKEFSRVFIENETVMYKYFIHTCPDYYIQEDINYEPSEALYDSLKVKVIQHHNFKEVVYLY